MSLKSLSFLVVRIRLSFRQVAAITASGSFIFEFLRILMVKSAISSVMVMTFAKSINSCASSNPAIECFSHPKNSILVMTEMITIYLKYFQFYLTLFEEYYHRDNK